ncbi:hypothetical protein SUDANB180_01144 [Streptomyces sp. enrichment culture]
MDPNGYRNPRHQTVPRPDLERLRPTRPRAEASPAPATPGPRTGPPGEPVTHPTDLAPKPPLPLTKARLHRTPAPLRHADC